MSRKIILFFMTLFTATMVFADPTPVTLTPVKTKPNDGTHPRTPVAMPALYLDGHTLTASDYTLGSTIQLLDEDGEEVFSTYIYIEGDITLPADLSGTYTIEVTRGSITFIGEIEL